MARKGAKTKRMKFTKEMQDRIIKWVELNGLYPQPCGATVQSLCEAGRPRHIPQVAKYATFDKA